MTLSELNLILQSTGLPVAYSHFVEADNSPLPEPPFIVYLITYSSNQSADDQVYKQIQNVQIELYTDKKDLDSEAILERILNENDLPFSTTETYIESEALFQKIYEVRLI
jgi:hypothetical protein